MRDGPIDAAAAAAGAYVGLLGYGFGAAIGVDREAVLVSALLGWLAVALAVSQRPRLWVALGRRRLLGTPMIAPMLPAVALSVALEYEPTDVSLSTLFWLLALLVVGMIIWVAGTTNYADQAAGARLASWTATRDAVSRRRTTVGVALGVLGSVGAVVAMLLYRLPSAFLTMFAAMSATAWIKRDRARTYEACERGLRYSESGAVGAQFLPWTRFDGVSETEDAVVLERRWWFDIRMDGDDVPADVRETLAASLDA